MESNEIDTYLRALDAELAQRPIRKPVMNPRIECGGLQAGYTLICKPWT